MCNMGNSVQEAYWSGYESLVPTAKEKTSNALFIKNCFAGENNFFLTLSAWKNDDSEASFYFK